MQDGSVSHIDRNLRHEILAVRDNSKISLSVYKTSYVGEVCVHCAGCNAIRRVMYGLPNVNKGMRASYLPLTCCSFATHSQMARFRSTLL